MRIRALISVHQQQPRSSTPIRRSKRVNRRRAHRLFVVLVVRKDCEDTGVSCFLIRIEVSIIEG